MELQTINSIIKTLCYAEIFSYPLTFFELHKYLISAKKISRRELLYALSQNSAFFDEEKGFITFRGGKHLVRQRLIRMEQSRKKLAKALWIASILSSIPTIQLIGISGSLSMYNAKKEDDIDLFFITRAHSLWISRFLVVLTLFVLRQKRGKGKTIPKDKICPNMFLSENALEVIKSKQNLYTAHEVSQLKILFAKKNIKEKFFAKNKWVLKYMPHAFEVNSYDKKDAKTGLTVKILDTIFYKFQKAYMKKKITNEVVEKHIALFHPIPMGKTISSLYNLKKTYRLKRFKSQQVSFQPQNLPVN